MTIIHISKQPYARCAVLRSHTAKVSDVVRVHSKDVVKLSEVLRGYAAGKVVWIIRDASAIQEGNRPLIGLLTSMVVTRAAAVENAEMRAEGGAVDGVFEYCHCGVGGGFGDFKGRMSQ